MPAPRVEVPAEPPVIHPVVVQDGTVGTDGRRWRFALVSDAQFTASNQSLVPAAHRTFDHNGTRFLLLDSSLGNLRGGGFEQWTMLRDAIDGAARDDSVNGVVAMWHYPPRDPSPLKNSQLGDREEAEVSSRSPELGASSAGDRTIS